MSVIPCKKGDCGDSVNLPGFLVHVVACECKMYSRNAIDCGHAFEKSVFIYFYGSVAASWHPAITKLVGRTFALSGMKKKLVYVSKCDSVLVFVTTENSVIHSPWISKKQRVSKTVVDRRVNCGTYLGFVKGGKRKDC